MTVAVCAAGLASTSITPGRDRSAFSTTSFSLPRYCSPTCRTTVERVLRDGGHRGERTPGGYELPARLTGRSPRRVQAAEIAGKVSMAPAPDHMVCHMGEAWNDGVNKAAREIASAVEDRSAPRTVAEEFGNLLNSLGKAAGHAEHLASHGSAGRTAREHFRQHMLDAGAVAVLMLRRSYERQGRPTPAPTELTGALARRRVIPGQRARTQAVEPPPGHAAGALGAAIVALGRAVTLIGPDEENLRAFDDAMESVLAASIAAVARVPG